MGRLDGRTILIVDDDEDILESMDLAMRAEGATTMTAADGTEAVAQCTAHEPEVVILDMMLPRRSGFLILEDLQGLDHPPVIIMVTANEGRRHMAYAKSLGVHDYLIKPISLDRLIDSVCTHLEAGGGE